MNTFAGEEETLLEPHLDPEDYFAVHGLLWDPHEEDHTIEISHEMGFKRFSEMSDARTHYDRLKYDDFQVEAGGDIKVELLHFRFGFPHRVATRILFPPA
jgi:hypothetical protein